MQDFPAAEKILFDIENVLKKNEHLQSFEIIIATDDENKSPVYCKSNSLGLASWCVQPLYCYVYNRLMEFRRNKLRRVDPEIVARWLLGVLLLNSDINTFWNMRRELVQNGYLDAQQELHFSKIILYHNPKCFEAFSYRRLLIKRIQVNSQHFDNNVESLLRDEISIAIVSADRYLNNYHAWNHRQYILLAYGIAIPDNFFLFLVNEWAYSEKWCRQHVSDYGGFSYRQFLLKQFFYYSKSKKFHIFMTSEYLMQRLAIVFLYIKTNLKQFNEIPDCEELACQILDMLHEKQSGDKRDVHYHQVLFALSYWIEDCTLNQNLISSFPGHESLWCHRRFLAYFLRSLITSYLKDSCCRCEFFLPSSKNYQITRNKDSENHDYSKNFLEKVFKNYNIKIMISTQKHEIHQNNLIKNFKNFLTTIDMKI